MFPLNKKLHCMKQRNKRKFVVNHANTERYYKSSIPYMQKLLSSEHRNLKKLSMVNDYASESCQIDSITTDNLHYNK